MTGPLHVPEKAFLKSLHISPRFGVVYVNTPKVACSSIKLTPLPASAPGGRNRRN